MDTSVVVLVAACVADAALIVVWLWFFRNAINVKVFVRYLVKLDGEGERARAVKLCRAAQSTLVSRYAAFLFSLRIPAKTMQDAAGGFRDAVPSEDFQVVMKRESNRVRSALERKVHFIAVAGITSSLIAISFSLVFLHVLGRWPWEDWNEIDDMMAAGMGAAGVGLFGLQSFARSWVNAVRALRLVKSKIEPRLVPEERMTEDQIAAADDAGRMISGA